MALDAFLADVRRRVQMRDVSHAALAGAALLLAGAIVASLASTGSLAGLVVAILVACAGLARVAVRARVRVAGAGAAAAGGIASA